jgi:hypothetical protein
VKIHCLAFNGVSLAQELEKLHHDELQIKSRRVIIVECNIWQ